MIVVRRELGEVLRGVRTAKGLTLRQLSAAAAVSLGYLSEIERGEKEASSEMLAAIAAALDVPLSVVYADLASRVAAAEAIGAPVPLPVRTAPPTPSASAA